VRASADSRLFCARLTQRDSLLLIAREGGYHLSPQSIKHVRALARSSSAARSRNRSSTRTPPTACRFRASLPRASVNVLDAKEQQTMTQGMRRPECGRLFGLLGHQASMTTLKGNVTLSDFTEMVQFEEGNT
jgi:hypothetical protein